MSKKVYIITGASRGIGEALARHLMHPDHIVVCISRNKNPRLHVEAVARGCRVHDYDLDLNDLDRLRGVMDQVFHLFHADEVSYIALVNNAGTVAPIRRIGAGEAGDKVRRAISVNLTSAMLITDAFVRHTQDWPVEKRVINMSSGAAKRAYAGWSAYCVAKAGLEMLTQCMAAEQQGHAHPVKCISFAPGVVDTEMQAEIRHADPEQFSDRQRFITMKEEGKLLTPAYVAERLAALLHSPGFGQELSLDIRTMDAQ